MTPGTAFVLTGTLLLTLSACGATAAGCSQTSREPQTSAAAPVRAERPAKATSRDHSQAALVVRVRIASVIPIGWGTTFRGQVEEVVRGKLPGGGEYLNFAAAVGAEKIFPDLDVTPEAGAVYLLGFSDTGKTSERPYLPNGRTGFLDADRRIWDLVSVDRQ